MPVSMSSIEDRVRIIGVIDHNITHMIDKGKEVEIKESLRNGVHSLVAVSVLAGTAWRGAAACRPSRVEMLEVGANSSCL